MIRGFDPADLDDAGNPRPGAVKVDYVFDFPGVDGGTVRGGWSLSMFVLAREPAADHAYWLHKSRSKTEIAPKVKTYKDFASEKTMLQWYAIERGHTVIYGVRFHSECATIESMWAYIVAELRKQIDGRSATLLAFLLAYLAYRSSLTLPVGCSTAPRYTSYCTRSPSSPSPVSRLVCPRRTSSPSCARWRATAAARPRLQGTRASQQRASLLMQQTMPLTRMRLTPSARVTAGLRLRPERLLVLLRQLELEDVAPTVGLQRLQLVATARPLPLQPLPALSQTRSRPTSGDFCPA
jgi:hypothetical protein